MAASLHPPATSPGTSTGYTTSPASDILLRLPGELHLQISSYLDQDLVSMALAVASDNYTSCSLLPYYIPRLSDEKRRLLTIALLTGFPITSLCWILDVLVFGIETEHAEVLHSSDMFTWHEEYWRGRALASWRIIAPHDWQNDASAHRVGILNAAAALGKVGVLRALFGRIMSWMDMAALEQGILTRYPTAVHYACLEHAPAALHVVFSDNVWLPPAFWRCTPFCLAVTGFRFPGRTQQDVLSVLEILERYPAVAVVPSEGHVHWLQRLNRSSVKLPVPILRVLIRRMPFTADQRIEGVIRALADDPTPSSLGYMQVLLLEARSFSWMAENVTGFLPKVPELWNTLLDTLVHYTSHVTRQWRNFLSLMEVLVTISQRLSPRGFAGDQTLCFAILTSEGVTSTPNEPEEGAPTPPQYLRPFVDALVRAGADLDGMWVDGEPRKARRDSPRMASYRNWTARQLLEKIQQTGRL
ncbi:hypothetical protein FN846DRAFT_902313 [Sphaerosporella brunnea]|uniref:Uncharacterized protein n=1 Tax=Sphaerosporella brunnea TaxID=1250544 RepID=A0A5J5FAD4_9PEZI|nr:hypothetical protein FN846DRAFT_902313 [Sphaerosporella brunnea]